MLLMLQLEEVMDRPHLRLIGPTRRDDSPPSPTTPKDDKLPSEPAERKGEFTDEEWEEILRNY